jgi:hypothetical protein
MKKLIIIFILISTTTNLLAQSDTSIKKIKRLEKEKKINAIIKQEEEGIPHFKKHFAGGLKLVNDGSGLFFEYAKTQSTQKSMLFQLEITERKHGKEEKLQNSYSPTAPVIYGKINFFYPVKLGFQEEFLLGNKGNRNGISISGNFGGGISLGLLRPYLVEVDKNGTYTFVGYNSPDSNYFLNGPIVGGPSISEGWKQLSVVPGIYLKPSVRFDYGKYNELISAIEIGASAEYYTKNIPQMINIKQHRLFLSAFVSLVFGKRK